MEYPLIEPISRSRQMIDTFLGYNHNLRIGDGEFYEMENMSSDHFPTLSPRKDRETWYKGKFSALTTNDYDLIYVDEEKLVIDDVAVNLFLTPGKKQLITMGSYVIVMPDKKWVNTAKTNYIGNYQQGGIDAEYVADENVLFTLCNLTGTSYDAEASATPRIDPNDGDLWIDTSDNPHILKKYSASENKWISIATTYIKIDFNAQGIDLDFSEGDGVEISGIVADGATGLNGSHVILGIGADYIIIQGIIDNVADQEGGVKISRKMPEVDFVFEANNRLWGCRYGWSQTANAIVNEIYASKLGDFKNWNCYMGISTDSYGITVGEGGNFTGGISYGGNPIFFKENCMMKIYGEYPANFRMQTIPCRGVMSGGKNTLAIVDNVLFYKSKHGVCAYDGSLPSEITDIFGGVHYDAAVAGGHHGKYYISMRKWENGQVKGYNLFVFDTQKKLWHKEDNFNADAFCSMGDLYALDGDTGNIIKMTGQKSISNETEWMVETGLIGMTLPDMKYISKLLVRLSLAEGANVRFLIQYDSVGAWQQVCAMRGTTLRSYSVPILPRRCDHFRMRIEGNGDCKIYSITKTIEQGSDVS